MELSCSCRSANQETGRRIMRRKKWKKRVNKEGHKESRKWVIDRRNKLGRQETKKDSKENEEG